MRRTVLAVLALAGFAGGCSNLPQARFDNSTAVMASSEDHQAPSGGRARSAAAQADMHREGSSVASEGPVPTFSVVDARKMVYTGDFVVVVGEVRRAQSQIQQSAEEMGGYLDRLKGNHMTVRVPAQRFQEAVGNLDEVGTVAGREISAQDVTNRYLDLQTRLENSKAMAKRLRELVAKAEKVEDALKVEKELTRLMTEIDRLEGSLRLLKNQVAFATLNIELKGAVEYVPPKLNVKLPIHWLREVGLQELLRFGNRQIY